MSLLLRTAGEVIYESPRTPIKYCPFPLVGEGWDGGRRQGWTSRAPPRSRPWPTRAGAFTLDELRVMPGDHALTCIWEGAQEISGLDPVASQGGCDPVAECANARVLG